MSSIFRILLCLLVLPSCAVETSIKEIVINDTKVQVEIPEEFREMKASQWNKMTATSQLNNINERNIKFVVNYSDLDYFTIETNSLENYIGECKDLKSAFFNISSQIYNQMKQKNDLLTLDTTHTSVVIDGKLFYKENLIITIDGIVQNSVSYVGQLGDSIVYTNVWYSSNYFGSTMIRKWEDATFN